MRIALKSFSIRSEEWNTTRISNKNRLSSYLFFLRNRGHDLLKKVVEEHEPVNDPEFIDLILHTVVCLCRLPAQNLPLIEQKLDRRNRTVSKSQRKKEFKKVKCEKRPMIKPLHRVLQSALTDEDKDHDYSVILANSTAIIRRVSYPGILYLRPITDLLRNLAAAHGDRVKIAFLIALVNNLREQITCDRVVIEDGSQTVKMMMEIITLAKLLLLDGEDSLGLNVILILINILRRVQLDHLFSASWSYMLNLKLLELTPLSNFTNIPVLKGRFFSKHFNKLTSFQMFWSKYTLLNLSFAGESTRFCLGTTARLRYSQFNIGMASKLRSSFLWLFRLKNLRAINPQKFVFSQNSQKQCWS